MRKHEVEVKMPLFHSHNYSYCGEVQKMSTAASRLETPPIHAHVLTHTHTHTHTHTQIHVHKESTVIPHMPSVNSVVKCFTKLMLLLE